MISFHLYAIIFTEASHLLVQALYCISLITDIVGNGSSAIPMDRVWDIIVNWKCRFKKIESMPSDLEAVYHCTQLELEIRRIVYTVGNWWLPIKPSEMESGNRKYFSICAANWRKYTSEILLLEPIGVVHWMWILLMEDNLNFR